jgi:poly-gamma-glutamate synthesis protein (capsule biosynthesis protein)
MSRFGAAMKKKLTKFTATGDSFITRCLPHNPNDRSFSKIKEIIGEADARFANLETTIQSDESYPSAISGGTWARSSPDVLNVLKACGFNLMAWANNHTLDYSHGGLLSTKKYLDKFGFIHAGAGKNLAEASAPSYLECASARVALIAATSTLDKSWCAGEQRRDCKGRPGVNPLRYDTKYLIDPEKMRQLEEIAGITGINDENNLKIMEGFMAAPEEDLFMFGDSYFKEVKNGEEEGKTTNPNEKDIQRIIENIVEARRRADYVIISIHSHEMKGELKETPAEFLTTFARKCIDSGAHAVIGHGPHIIRGIEIYKRRPIFYSLGNFIFHTMTVASLPADFYEKYGLGPMDNAVDALETMSKGYTRGLYANPLVWEAFIPFWSMEDGELVDLKLYPIELGFGQPVYRMGWPVLSSKTDVFERLKELSKPYGTSMEIGESICRVKIK